MVAHGESIKGMLWEGRIDEVAALRRGVVKRLVAALADKKLSDLAACTLAKVAVKTKIPEAIKPLIKALDRRNSSLRQCAAMALGAAAANAELPEVVAPLVNALDDELDV